MTADQKNSAVYLRLSSRIAGITLAHAATLRRAALILHRWAEQECGDGNNFASWCIERDETTGKTYRAVYPHNAPSYRTRIADRETAALARVARVCKAIGAHFYHQTDPRGCALYVAAEPLTDQNYSTAGMPCNA